CIIDTANPLGNLEKREGYEQALAEAGIDIELALSVDPKGHSAESGYFAMDAMMSGKKPPSAVFAANDSLAIGALRWCAKNGRKVPEDVAIMGFDNIEYAEYASTPLST